MRSASPRRRSGSACTSASASDGTDVWLLVDDALDLWVRDLAVGRFVVTFVVPRDLAFALGLLVAVVRRPDTPMLVFGFARRNRDRRHLFIVCHRSSPPAP